MSDFIKVARLDDLAAKGLKAVRVENRLVLLVKQENRVFAIDNRCPHMGFPLERGTVKDGLITCHWHHARFDLCSGGTLDLFADDVRTYPLELHGSEIWVNPNPQRDEQTYQLARLKSGLEQTISLVMAKAVISLMETEANAGKLLELAGLFGTTQRHAGWRDGLTILTAMSNCLPYLAEEDKALALYHGMLHVASNVEGQRPHFELEPLPSHELGLTRLKAWLRDCAEVRDRDGMERVILTAIAAGYGAETLADMLLAAVTDHYFLDTGHSIDFINKAFELLDMIGWNHAAQILPSILPGISNATRMEETNAWRNPVDIPALVEPQFKDLLSINLQNNSKPLEPVAFSELVDTLLGDDPVQISAALAEPIQKGITLTDVSLALCLAAAKRVARFHTSNEFGDWITVLHSFTSANATHQLLKRAASLEGARALWHNAMHLYLNRFLNAPAARQPTDSSVQQLSTTAPELLKRLLELGDQCQKVEEAAAICYRYLQQGHDDTQLIQTLAQLLLREDGEFHTYQMLEAGLSLYQELKQRFPIHAPDVLMAVTRYLAGHAPTDRATTQTYRIAIRLHAGEALAAD